MGEPEALDLLIAPAVLVREKAPKEDCDGFTMLVCCLLKILEVPIGDCDGGGAIPESPERWSHVFPMALINGGLPLDASHGESSRLDGSAAAHFPLAGLGHERKSSAGVSSNDEHAAWSTCGG